MMNGLLHLRDFNVELVLLVRDKLIESVATLGQGYLEVDLSELELLLVVVHARGEVLVEGDNVVADLTHLIDRIVHVVDGVRVERLRLKLPPISRWRDLILHDGVECLSLFQLSVILDQEVLEVILCNVDVLICVLHVLGKLVGQLVENNARLVVILLQLLLLCFDELLCELSGRAHIDGFQD